MKRNSLVLSLLILMVSAVPAAHSQVAVSSQIDLKASADAGIGAIVDTDFASQGATLNALAASVIATAVDPFAPAFAIAEAGAAASWSNAGSGTVGFTNVGWRTDLVNNGHTLPNLGSDFSYVFQATGTGLLTVNFSVNSAGTSLFGLNGFGISLTSGSSFDSMFSTESQVGSWNTAVVNGETYTFQIKNAANISGGLTTRDAHMNGTFDWSISGQAAPSVPEPGTVAMIGAFAAVGGGALIRRRK